MNSNVTSLLLLIAVSATLLNYASALECYFCNGSANKNCSDIANAQKMECRGGEEFCNKIVLNGDITRGCYKEEEHEDHQVGCRTSGATTSCFCDTDGCNGAVTIGTAQGSGAQWKFLAAIAAVLGARMVL